MKNRNLLLKIVLGAFIAFLLFSLAAPAIFPQASAPRQEKLLNGLKVLMFSDRARDNVSLKVRIHSGSAFDPQGKEGVMRLLAENIFPNPDSRLFFSEELSGALTIESNYDYIQVTASAKSDQLLTLLETVATAITDPPIDKENTARLKADQLARLAVMARDPAYLADRMAYERLLGTFPYGRPRDGTRESVDKIDYADLLAARQRFMTADNATIALSGRYDQALAFRAIRRFFGAWLKSDRLTPSTFRQPDDPPGAVLKLDSPDPDRYESRVVMRGTSRSAADLAAYSLAAYILESRSRRSAPSGHSGLTFVRSSAYALPGTFEFAVSGKKDASSSAISPMDAALRLLASPVTDAEFQDARQAFFAEYEKGDVVDRWLDMDTYKLDTPAIQKERASAVTLADVQRVMEKLRKQPSAAVVVEPAVTAN